MPVTERIRATAANAPSTIREKRRGASEPAIASVIRCSPKAARSLSNPLRLLRMELMRAAGLVLERTMPVMPFAAKGRKLSGSWPIGK